MTEPLPSSAAAAAASSSSARRGEYYQIQWDAPRPRLMHHLLHTRSLSEMLVLSPRGSSRRSREQQPRQLDMDIEIASTWTKRGRATLNWMTGAARSSTLGSSDEEEDDATEDPTSEPEMEIEEENQQDEEERPAAMAPPARDVSSVIDVLFDIHAALKTQQLLGKRTAASALAASNLVTLPPSSVSKSDDSTVEQTVENFRLMLTCAICQELLEDATDIGCCGQTFCYGCVERWVHEKSSCPMCRRDGVSEKQLRANRHAQRMADEIEITCPHCHVGGGMKHGQLRAHLRECAAAPAPAVPEGEALRKAWLRYARGTLPRLRSFLRSPFPATAATMQCYIRARMTSRYELYTLEGDVLLAVAERRRHMNMTVTYQMYCHDRSLLHDPTGAGDAATGGFLALDDANLIGQVDRNFVGSQYTISMENEGTPATPSSAAASSSLGAVQYAATYGKSPRQMRVAVPLVASVDPDSSDDDSDVALGPRWHHVLPEEPVNMLEQIQHPDAAQSLIFVNKPPVWIESLEAYCLDFGGRVSSASVKNFLLANPVDMDQTIMLFGRTQDRNIYSMDFSHPLSPIQAFAIALSSMDSHLVTFD